MKIKDRLYKKALAWMFKDWHTLSVQQQRAKLDQLDKFSRLSRGAEFRKVHLGNTPAVHITVNNRSEKTVIYFHGGSFVLRGTKNHLNLCADIAKKTNTQVFLVDYRLAPEDPFPCALEDGLEAYRSCIEKGIHPNTIILGGDSAGGGLALSLLGEIGNVNLPMPAGAFCFSPWTDLTLSGRSHVEKAQEDPMLKTSGLKKDARKYAGKHRLDSPRISPLFSSMENFPPILLQVGMDEILLDDARRFYENARDQSVPIELQVWPGMVHVFQTLPFLAERDQSIAHVVSFIEGKGKKETVA